MANEVFAATKVHRWHSGGVTHGIYDISFSAAYATGGDDFGVVSSQFRKVLFVEQVNDDPNQVLQYHPATDKLSLWLENDTSGIYEEPNSADEHAVVARIHVVGL